MFTVFNDNAGFKHEPHIFARIIFATMAYYRKEAQPVNTFVYPVTIVSAATVVRVSVYSVLTSSTPTHCRILTETIGIVAGTELHLCSIFRRRDRVADFKSH
jgi:hypothetical protein